MSRWNSDLATGNPAIDKDHQELVEILEHLRGAAAAGDQKARLSHALDLFRSHVLAHFPAEEREMEAAGYPALAKHRVAHAHLTNLVIDLVGKDGAGEAVLYADVEQLGSALYRHILLEDKPFADHLRRGR